MIIFPITFYNLCSCLHIAFCDSVVNMLLTLSMKISSCCENHSISLDLQTRNNALRSQSDLQNQNMQIPALKESSTNLVIPGPCQKETLSTSKQISQVMCLNMPFNILYKFFTLTSTDFSRDEQECVLMTLNLRIKGYRIS